MQSLIIATVLIVILAKLAWETSLTLLNMAEARRHAKAPPPGLRTVMDKESYAKSVDYTLAKAKLALFSDVYGIVILLAVLFSGVLPWLYSVLEGLMAPNAWRESLYVILVFTLLAIPGLPLEHHAQFRLEERFGFNKSTLGLWVTDKIKGLLVGLAIAAPLLTLIFFLVERAGPLWWIWAFAAFFAFQLLLMVLYPMLILPLFNKLTPLSEGGLKDRLMRLAERAGFKCRTIQVMDGSKRSGHSNAFFTGFGRFRRIVFFDTLMEQLTEEELEAVLAHEIGHYKLGHVPKMLVLSAGLGLAAFAVLAWLLATPAFVEAFGFSHAAEGMGPAFVLFALLAGSFGFWLSPLLNLLSRRHEYAADRFAREHAGGTEPMVKALRRLSEKNLSNLTPHPLYSAFHSSHPTLLEREAALRGK